MGLASCHPSGALYFETAPKFVELVCIASLDYLCDCNVFGIIVLHVGN
jgi:hypothetical protein